MKNFLAITLLTFLFVSCKKDDPATPNGGLLDKTIAVDNSDTTTGTYTYDANNRLSSTRFVSRGSSGFDSITTNITRDASGRIIQLVEVETGFQPIISTIVYNGTSSQLKYKLRNFAGMKGDSVAYVYNGSSITEYFFYYAGSSWMPMSRDEFIYQNGNLVTMKHYDISTGSLQQTTTFTYDSKKPAIKFSPEEALITGFFDFGFENNITGYTSVDHTDPTNNLTVNLAYTYATSGQPLTANITAMPGGAGSIKYFYK